MSNDYTPINHISRIAKVCDGYRGQEYLILRDVDRGLLEPVTGCDGLDWLVATDETTEIMGWGKHDGMAVLCFDQVGNEYWVTIDDPRATGEV